MNDTALDLHCGLWIDDDAAKMEMQLWAGILLEEGLQVELVADPQYALNLLANPSCDCDYSFVLLDLAMPGLDGVETLKRIRKLDSRIPVIIVSANLEEPKFESRLREYDKFIMRIEKPFPLAHTREFSEIVDQLHSLADDYLNGVSGDSDREDEVESTPDDGHPETRPKVPSTGGLDEKPVSPGSDGGNGDRTPITPDALDDADDELGPLAFADSEPTLKFGYCGLAGVLAAAWANSTQEISSPLLFAIAFGSVFVFLSTVDILADRNRFRGGGRGYY